MLDLVHYFALTGTVNEPCYHHHATCHGQTLLPSSLAPGLSPLRSSCVILSLSLSLSGFVSFFFYFFLNKAETNLECSLALKGQKKKNYDESKGRIMLKKYEHFQLFNTYCSESDLAFICLC